MPQIYPEQYSSGEEVERGYLHAWDIFNYMTERQSFFLKRSHHLKKYKLNLKWNPFICFFLFIANNNLSWLILSKHWTKSHSIKHFTREKHQRSKLETHNCQVQLLFQCIFSIFFSVTLICLPVSLTENFGQQELLRLLG